MEKTGEEKKGRRGKEWGENEMERKREKEERL